MSISDTLSSLKDRQSACRFLRAVGELQQEEPPEALWPQYGVSDRASSFFQRANLGVTVAPELDNLRDELGHGQFNAAMRYLQQQHLIEPKGWETQSGLSLFLKLTDTGQKIFDALLLASTPASANAFEYDVFISYASEDNEDFVRPLANRLQEEGVRVWYDRIILKVGDSLNRSINAGLARSRFGIVVVSPSFLAKEWPQRELDGLATREVDGTKVILPIWHNLQEAQVRSRSPLLADRIAVASSAGLDRVVERLLEVIRP